jgi:hypothetical protein
MLWGHTERSLGSADLFQAGAVVLAFCLLSSLTQLQVSEIVVSAGMAPAVPRIGALVVIAIIQLAHLLLWCIGAVFMAFGPRLLMSDSGPLPFSGALALTGLAQAPLAVWSAATLLVTFVWSNSQPGRNAVQTLISLVGMSRTVAYGFAVILLLRVVSIKLNLPFKQTLVATGPLLGFVAILIFGSLALGG